MNNFFPYLITIIIVWIISKYLPNWYKKLASIFKIQQLGEDYINEIRSQFNPKKYTGNNVLSSIALMIFLIIGGLIFSIGPLLLGKTFIEKGFLYQGPSPSIGSVVTFLILFCSGLVIGCAFCLMLADFVLPRNYKNYLILMHVDAGFPYGFIAMSKIFLIYGVIPLFFISPLVYFTIHEKKVLYPDKIVVRDFFDFKDNIYTYKDIDRIIVKPYITEDDVGARVYITLKNGQKLDFVLYVKDNVEKIYGALEKEGKVINIIKPSLDEMASTRRACQAVQESFCAAFRLDQEEFSRIRPKLIIGPAPTCYQ